VKQEASAYHASQGGGGNGRFGFLPLWLQKRLFGQEMFMRAYPAPSLGYREQDLFGN
jgi:hypothetical protein